MSPDRYRWDPKCETSQNTREWRVGKAKELKVDAATGGRSSIDSDEQEGTKK